MKKSNIIWAVVIGLIVVLGLYFWSSYNKLVTTAEATDSQWQQVETQYQRRFDLIPNLVETVKGAMQQEKDVFGRLADARAKYSGATSPSEKAQAATAVESSLSRLLVIMENYPQLKSSETVQTLMSQLEGTENRISVERKRFNEQVQSYNILVKRFPGSLVASLFNFEGKDYFQSQAGSENAPQVKF